LPQDLGARHIRVNIAGFELEVVENGSPVMQMRVIVGQQYRQTPVFSGDITYLVLSPYWHVPSSIAVKDKLPLLKKNPGALSQQGYEIFRGWGADAQAVDPTKVDWSTVSVGNFPYRLRQKPGPNNALGRVKFMFPNPHNVYLHDTPSRELFARSERGFSSGCIRVQQPMELTQYLLADQPEWTPERIQRVIDSRKETSVRLKQAVPVHLLYWTAWAEGDGTVHFRRDIYGRDARLQSALDAPLAR
jgi:murein L,D-transpeptidase YcbB/YkuD